MLNKSNQKSFNYVRQSAIAPLWMRNSFRIIGIDGTCKSVSGGPPIKRESNEKQSLKFQLQAQTAHLSSIFRSAFLPVGYPETVSPRYFKYIGYNMIQVTFISLSRVLSTQAMLIAVGLGQGSALPLAAVMNWWRTTSAPGFERAVAVRADGTPSKGSRGEECRKRAAAVRIQE